MAQQIQFHNETHWRTSDIQRIVRLAAGEAQADLTEPRVVRAVFGQKPKKATKKKAKTKRRVANASVVNIRFDSTVLGGGRQLKAGGPTSEITLYLPRRGRKDPHPVAMVALAASAAVAGKVDEDDTLLPFSDVYFISNYLAYYFACEAKNLYEDEDGQIEARRARLEPYFREVSPPSWADPSKLFIAKYRDPLKDATYLDFVAKKETAIKRETTTIARLEKEIKAAEKNLRAAKRRKKAAQKAIRDATERRTS